VLVIWGFDGGLVGADVGFRICFAIAVVIAYSPFCFGVCFLL